MSETQRARALLVEIEAELARLDLWETLPPAPEKLESTAPFAFDTLEFHQWLRWIFVPRTHALLDAGGRLPSDCSIGPMAEWYAGEKALLNTSLVTLLKRFDALWAA